MRMPKRWTLKHGKNHVQSSAEWRVNVNCVQQVCSPLTKLDHWPIWDLVFNSALWKHQELTCSDWIISYTATLQPCGSTTQHFCLFYFVLKWRPLQNNTLKKSLQTAAHVNFILAEIHAAWFQCHCCKHPDNTWAQLWITYSATRWKQSIMRRSNVCST